MKYITIATIGLISFVDAQRCNNDNCARAVTGTRAGIPVDISSRRSDCSSYMQTTVIPDTFTSTVTTTVYTDNIPPTPTTTFSQSTTRAPITQFPTAVPSYVTPQCPGPSAYSSACSCWSITHSVTTLPAPVTTVTATEYANPGCRGAHDCPFDGVNVYRCGGGGTPATFCTCLREAGGKDNGGGRRQVCVEKKECNEARTCTSSNSCNSGEACVWNYCCNPQRRRICLKYAPLACGNPTSPGNIFEERREAVEGGGNGMV
ncbi:hypothetical protein CSAL01_03169 [Colletotrichum salicis]|uniref:Uncharacterized protein n=1 Tax=Colletotrichum salicis TaxID=1209931 RepID=A0A135STA1_9PEZI|nr:hypothetical protein CSAL01_03169 [Colletotrichum salicis]